MLKKTSKLGFTLAEALVLLLVSALAIVATMPVLTKKVKDRLRYKLGPADGWLCEKSSMPCHFVPPANAKNFVIYFDDNTIPSFSTPNMGEINIVAAKKRITETIPGPCEMVEEEVVDLGLGKHDTSWDDYKKEHTIQEDDELSNQITNKCQPSTVNVIEPGGCGTTPDLYSAFEDYINVRNIKIKGDFCTGAEKIRIFY